MKNLQVHCLIAVLLMCISQADRCLDNNGQVVDWWVKLIFPATIPGGFGYFDSSYAAPSFVIYQNQADSADSALARTLNQINTLQLDSIAWNDQKPNGTTSSVKAHSKSVLAFSQNSTQGFLFVHSIPQYPAFNGFSINTTIDDSQRVYGQHSFCFNIDNVTYYDLISKIMPIRPFIYAQNFYNKNTINGLIASGTVPPPDYSSNFTNKTYTLNNTPLVFIFKNGGINASIFEDGLNNLLQSPLLAETWGRPIQDPWCGSQLWVGNVLNIKFSETVQWKETQDHSKWVYAVNKDYACFGDMNRMASQWKRGGAFYCLNSQLLKQSLVAITSQSAVC